MAAGDNQRLKMLYLVKILSEETDEAHGLSLQDIAAKLEGYGVNADRKTLYREITLQHYLNRHLLKERRARALSSPFTRKEIL